MVSKSNKKRLENEKDIPVQARAPVHRGDVTLVKGISRPKRRFIPPLGLFSAVGLPSCRVDAVDMSRWWWCWCC